MRRFWKHDRWPSELEDELRARRSDPPTPFVRMVAKSVRGGHGSLRPKFRMSLAHSVALLAVVALVAAGGVGLVGSGSSGAGNLIDRLASSSSPTKTVTDSSAHKQYKHKCGNSRDDDERCEVEIHDTTVQEPPSGCTNAVFSVTMDMASDQTVTATYTTKDGTASTADGDYLARNGTVTFLPGQTSQTINVPVCHDTGRTTEYFYVKLTSTSSNAVISGQNPETGTIKQ
jgi:Calx-beta domain